MFHGAAQAVGSSADAAYAWASRTATVAVRGIGEALGVQALARIDGDGAVLVCAAVTLAAIVGLRTMREQRRRALALRAAEAAAAAAAPLVRPVQAARA